MFRNAMWRSSLSFSSKLVSLSNQNFKFTNPLISATICSVGGVRTSLPHTHVYSSISEAPSAAGSLQLGFQRSELLGNSLFSSWNVVDLARHYGRCYWELSKARLSMLVVATSGTGFVLGSGNAIDFAGLCWTCTGTMMVAASANSLNQVFEVRNDAKMKRTMRRPLPSGRLTVPHAVIWASSIGLAGTSLLACKANMLAAGLAASNLVLYAFIYTPLKQIHPVNTWVGAVVGAIPPLLGWAAASGQVSLNGMILPAALYFWQIPHFMALAYLCRNDYAAGGFRMYSLADASGQRTASVALRNCLYLVPLGFLAYNCGLTSGWFCLESSILALAISIVALSFYQDRTAQKARRMFHASLFYLPVFMSGLLFHRIPENQNLDRSPNIPSVQENENVAPQKKQTRPPVAYASVAPFPFLPAPSYTAP